jgi:hypothetical protein
VAIVAFNRRFDRSSFSEVRGGEVGDPGSVSITAVLPSGEFGLWWEILRHAQPAALNCIAVTPPTRPAGPGKVMELHLIGGIGAALSPPGLGLEGHLTDRGGDTGRTSDHGAPASVVREAGP